MYITSSELWKNKEKQDHGLIGELHNQLEQTEQFVYLNSKTQQLTYRQEDVKSKKGQTLFRKLKGLYAVMGEIQSQDTFVTAKMLPADLRKTCKNEYGISSKELDRLVGDVQQGKTPEFKLHEGTPGNDTFGILNEGSRKMIRDKQADLIKEVRKESLSLSDEEIWARLQTHGSTLKAQDTVQGSAYQTVDYEHQEHEQIKGNRVYVKIAQSDRFKGKLRTEHRDTEFLDKLQKDQKKVAGMEELKKDLANKRKNLLPHQAATLSEEEIADYKKSYGLSKKDLEKLSQNIQADLGAEGLAEYRLNAPLRALKKQYYTEYDEVRDTHDHRISSARQKYEGKVVKCKESYQEKLAPLRDRKCWLTKQLPPSVEAKYQKKYTHQATLLNNAEIALKNVKHEKDVYNSIFIQMTPLELQTVQTHIFSQELLSRYNNSIKSLQNKEVKSPEDEKELSQLLLKRDALQQKDKDDWDSTFENKLSNVHMMTVEQLRNVSRGDHFRTLFFSAEQILNCTQNIKNLKAEFNARIEKEYEMAQKTGDPTAQIQELEAQMEQELQRLIEAADIEISTLKHEKRTALYSLERNYQKQKDQLQKELQKKRPGNAD